MGRPWVAAPSPNCFCIFIICICVCIHICICISIICICVCICICILRLHWAGLGWQLHHNIDSTWPQVPASTTELPAATSPTARNTFRCSSLCQWRKVRTASRPLEKSTARTLVQLSRARGLFFRPKLEHFCCSRLHLLTHALTDQLTCHYIEQVCKDVLAVAIQNIRAQ